MVDGDNASGILDRQCLHLIILNENSNNEYKVQEGRLALIH